MAGISPKLPLQATSEDGFYGLNKTLKETIAQNLKMLILTAPGERIMDPVFGVGLRNFLFNNYNRSFSSDIKEEIYNQVKRYIPSVKLHQVQILDFDRNDLIVDTDANTLGVRVIYSVPSLGIKNNTLNL
tara:strand:+ start:6879 stop:7268 length:390 start_codon:yes stop_codon:yes gene_type:complete